MFSGLNVWQCERFLSAEKTASTNANVRSIDDHDDLIDPAAVVPPMGEERFDVSHAGGELDAYKELQAAMNQVYVFYMKCMNDT